MTGRRKGTPCACETDPCSCGSSKGKCIRAINNVSPDPNGDFTLTPGDHIIFTEGDHSIEITADIPANSMIYQGTVGTGGTIPYLPSADPANQGYVYIAVSAASSPVVYDVGDVLISNGTTWEVIPSGDEIIPIVTSWQNPPDDAHVPSEKLVKDSLDDKLDKYSVTNPLDQFKIYAIGAPTQEVMLPYDQMATSNTIAMRAGAGGTLSVATPVNDEHAATKKYVDDAIAGISLDLVWSARTSNSDWSDIFENSGGLLKAKKHIILNSSSNPHFSLMYIPKGLETNNIHIECPYITQSGNTITVRQDMVLTTAIIPSNVSSIGVSGKAYTFTTDGTTVTITSTTSNGTYSKSSFKIFTAD